MIEIEEDKLLNNKSIVGITMFLLYYNLISFNKNIIFFMNFYFDDIFYMVYYLFF
jgi:hypothetical protein